MSEPRPREDFVSRVQVAMPAEKLAFRVSKSATLKILDLIGPKRDQKLRISVEGGGCSGFQYRFELVKVGFWDDIQISCNEDEEEEEGGSGSSVLVLLDAFSFMYLNGAELDYESNLNGERFIIRNPKAKTTCGCGSSFMI